MASIPEFTAARNITSLLHFTQLANLDSILARGMCPPQLCRTIGLAPATNDTIRYDGQDAICLSIEFPNYQLFWRFQNRDWAVKWAVIEFQVSVLWQKRCCFCATNAADSAISGQSFGSRQGLTALEGLFGDYAGKSRTALTIPDYYTTNPQAEVLCIDPIGPEFIASVYLNDLEIWKQYKAKYPQLSLKMGRFFTYRRDWAHWK